MKWEQTDFCYYRLFQGNRAIYSTRNPLRILWWRYHYPQYRNTPVRGFLAMKKHKVRAYHRRYGKVPLMALFALLVGCASQDLTRDEIEYRHGVDYLNWLTCMKAYHDNGRSTVHTYPASVRKPTHHEVRSDLIGNNCRWVLGEYWAEY